MFAGSDAGAVVLGPPDGPKFHATCPRKVAENINRQPHAARKLERIAGFNQGEDAMSTTWLLQFKVCGAGPFLIQDVSPTAKRPRAYRESRARPKRGVARWQSDGRGGEIRTRDLLVPNQALYQAKLHPDVGPGTVGERSEVSTSVSNGKR